MQKVRYALEHFYYGQAVVAGKPDGDERVLAASPGIDPVQAATLGTRLRLPPLIHVATGAWALVRGPSRDMPYVSIQAQQGEAGQVVSHFVLLMPDMLRAAAGDLQMLQRLLDETAPALSGQPTTLPPLSITPVAPLTLDAQIDHMLELMTITRNRIKAIESLLAAIVQGTPLVVQGAPVDLGERVQLIQGLLLLLPPSTRYGVTFATHSLPGAALNTQIRFLSDETPPDDAVVFNWVNAQTSGTEVKDDYSHYVASQLRLDAELVVQHNASVAAIAGWRLNQGDGLATALAYASSRLRLDSALMNNQPVTKEEVAQVLATDPTLSEDLMQLYARHLMQIALAMDDAESTLPVGLLLRERPDLGREVLAGLQGVLGDGRAWLVYDTLVRWMNHPLGPQGRQWVELTHQATLYYLRDLIKDEDIDEVQIVLEELVQAGPALNLKTLVSNLVKLCLPLATAHQEIASALFLLGVRELPDDELEQLLSIERFRRQIHRDMLQAWDYAAGHTDAEPDTENLVKVLAAQCAGNEAIVLLRLLESASLRSRFKLLRGPILRILFELAASEDGPAHSDRLRVILRAVEQRALPTIPETGRQYLLQTRLILGDYEAAAAQMLAQLRLYPSEQQSAYLAMVGRAFSDTAVPLQDIPLMVDAIQAGGVRAVPLVVAQMGITRQHIGEVGVDDLVTQAIDNLREHRNLMDIIPSEVVMGLLAHVIQRQDLTGLVRLLPVAPRAAYFMGDEGVRKLNALLRDATWRPEARQTAVYLLQAFIRLHDLQSARRYGGYFSKELAAALGSGLKRHLDVAALFRQMTGTADLYAYEAAVADTTALLTWIAQTYIDPRQVPHISTLVNGLNGITSVERLKRDSARHFSESIMLVGQAIVSLGRQYRMGLGREPMLHVEHTLKGTSNPASMLDALRIASGVLCDGIRYSVTIEPLSTPYPIQDLTLKDLVKRFAAARRVLVGLAGALPADRPPKLTASDVMNAMRSWLLAEGTHQGDSAMQDLAHNLQTLVEVIAQIESTGDSKAFEQSGLAAKLESGKQRPRSGLEFIRFLYGYFMSRA